MEIKISIKQKKQTSLSLLLFQSFNEIYSFEDKLEKIKVGYYEEKTPQARQR